MRIKLAMIALAMAVPGAALAESQSSNSSSNSSSNNGRTVSTVDTSYCEDGWCERTVERRVYRDAPRKRWRRRYR